MSSKHPDIMNFQHVNLSILQCVTDYIYTGVLTVDLNTVTEVLKLCMELELTEAVKVCEGIVTVKSELNGKQIEAEMKTTDKVSYVEMSDHYAESTDVETVEVLPKEKQKRYRKRLVSDKNDKTKNSKTTDIKPLKVPKLAGPFKRRRRNEDGIVKPKKPKQLNSELKRKEKKSLKVAGLFQYALKLGTL